MIDRMIVDQVLILSDGSGYIYQTRLSITTGEESSTAKVILLDKNMQRQWNTPFGKPVYFSISSLIETEDNGYLMAEAIQGIYGWCIKLDSEGT